ncbi:hypothetical protein QBC43DRAFT_198682 [Cladorrhinum sp. PSN259]|nr:hypothetical protein QBC43DRAFT_198682 [Cladorrhinum sp. PSN259]
MDRANESRAGQAATAIILSPIIASIAVVLRIYTRGFISKALFLEDYFIVCAMLSIMLQYVRISVMPFEKWICYAITAIIIAQSLTMGTINFILCTPFHAMWDRKVPGAKCLNITMIWYAQLGLTICTDFLVLTAPLFILRHLRLPWIQKLAISIVLSFGGMACIISVLRLLTVVQSTKSKDSTYDKVPSAVYGVIEPNLGIFCACIVTLRPLLRRYKPSQPAGGQALAAKAKSPSYTTSIILEDTRRTDTTGGYIPVD